MLSARVRFAGRGSRVRALAGALTMVAAVMSPAPRSAAAQTPPGELSARIGVEGRLFANAPLGPRQTANNGSISLQPRWQLEWDGRRQYLDVETFLRLDTSDPSRTHADIRTLSWEFVARSWVLRAGVRRVFWGVTESRHVVDIINQTDLVEDPDGEDKLGQPMVNLAWIRDWGTVDLFLMPLFRERTFPGPSGRLRSVPAVDTDRALFPDGDRRFDVAVRWAHTLGDFDVGLSHFYGLSRDPRFQLAAPADGERSGPVLLPVYEVIHQSGLDVQLTRGGWLWKLEGMLRSGQGPRFGAATGGFEYTFGGALGTAADLGILLEYTYDSRRLQATSPLQNDIFVGTRLALNDVQSTSVLAGGALDLETGSLLVSLEAERRVADAWTIEVEARAFAHAGPREPSWSLRRDDYVRVILVRYL